ncbi:MAG: T9SS type A sorting domain-containing protein, partial [Candidatus Marinimicrobia bacterium]|nr:T9SS type A sorting domain-containing protein [Candidatus Neomarinimicrobiota bacterium]
ANCTSCHMYGNASGGLTLTSYSGVMTNSNSGASVVPGDHANSLLWQKVNSGDMPQNNPDLNSDEVDLIAQWIDEGALEVQLSIIDETLPITYNLYNAYPNPFNPKTTLQYDLPEDAMVNITIYDMMGRQVKTLVNGSQTAGYKFIQWNATNDEGKPVSAGLYLYTIQAGEFRQTKKMVLLK